MGEARLFDGCMAPLENQVRRQSIGFGQRDAQPLQRLQHFNRNRPGPHRKPLAMQDLRAENGSLDPAFHPAEGGIHDVQMGIHAECCRKALLPIGALPLEEIAIVEVAVGAGSGNGLGPLVHRIIIGLAQHLSPRLRPATRPQPSPLTNINYLIQAFRPVQLPDDSIARWLRYHKMLRGHPFAIGLARATAGRRCCHGFGGHCSQVPFAGSGCCR